MSKEEQRTEIVNSGLLKVVDDEKGEENTFETLVIDSKEQYDAIILCQARKRAREIVSEERRRKKRARKAIWRKVRKYLYCFIMLLVIVFFVYHHYPVPKYDRETQTIYRDLDKAKFLISDLPDELPEMAWTDELPKFIKNDLQKILDEGQRAEYSFAGHTINISRSSSIYSEEYYLIMNVDGINGKNDVYAYDFNNSSIYMDDGALKWYYWCGEDSFGVITVSGVTIKQETLSNNAKDVPIEIDDENSWRIDDYVLIQNGNELSLWRNGYQVNSITSEVGDIRYVNNHYGMLVTTNNQLYGIDIYISRDTDYSAQIYLSYIDTIDEKSELCYRDPQKEFFFEFPKNVEYAFPIVKKNGESYVVLPEDISSYVSYSLANKGEVVWEEEKMNLKRHLVNVSDLQFVSASIYYGYSSGIFESFGWLANIEFKYNGTMYYYMDYPIYGYDRSYYLTDSEEEKLTRTVYSVDEFWKAVEEIRETYQNYYETQGG